LTYSQAFVILYGTIKKVYKTVFKFNKTFLEILILVYVVSGAICSLGFNGVDGNAKSDHIPDIHCGIDLKNYAPPEDRNSSFVDLTPCWGLLPQINEPHLPILSFSILKVPKPA
jgi:hypothetical protein